MFSEIKKHLKQQHIGVYINPDEIEKSFKQTGVINFNDFRLNNVSLDDLLSFLHNSSFLKDLFEKKHFDKSNIAEFKLLDNYLHIPLYFRDSYFSSIVSDFIRTQLMLKGCSLTFESVMSSKDKIEILEKAKKLGYRVYLYYISTVDPEINILRVASRVAMNGHNVASDKIKSRYYRSLENLFDASKYTNRTYFFDNSNDLQLFAQLSLDKETQESKLEFVSDIRPEWFQKYFLEKVDNIIQ